MNQNFETLSVVDVRGCRPEAPKQDRRARARAKSVRRQQRPIGRMSKERQRKRPRWATLATTAASKPSRWLRRPRGVPRTAHRFDSRFATDDGTPKSTIWAHAVAKGMAEEGALARNNQPAAARRAADGEGGRGRLAWRTDDVLGQFSRSGKLAVPRQRMMWPRRGMHPQQSTSGGAGAARGRG